MKLSYFPVRARAEQIRWLLAVGKQEYEENLIQMGDWPNIKPSMPFKQLPVLELDDGTKISQSLAVARYLADKFGLRGSNPEEAAKIDSYVDGWQGGFSMYGPIVRPFMSGDKDEMVTIITVETCLRGRNKAFDALLEKEFNPALDLYEKFLADNGTGYLVGSKLSWADLCCAEWLDRIAHHRPNCLDKHPGLKGLHAKVVALPEIVARKAKCDADKIAPL